MTAEKIQEFKTLVRGMTFEQAAEMLRTIDRLQSEQADWMREILRTQYPALAYDPMPNRTPQTVYLESAANRQQIDNLQQQIEALRRELEQRPHYTPVFTERPTSDYTPAQKGMFMVLVGVGATYAVAHFAGPAIIAAVGALLHGAVYALGAAVAGGVIYFICKPAETAPEQTPMDAGIVINQTVILNNDNR